MYVEINVRVRVIKILVMNEKGPNEGASNYITDLMLLFRTVFVRKVNYDKQNVSVRRRKGAFEIVFLMQLHYKFAYGIINYLTCAMARGLRFQ